MAALICLLQVIMDARVIGVRKHAVLRTAMPAHDATVWGARTHHTRSLLNVGDTPPLGVMAGLVPAIHEAVTW